MTELNNHVLWKPYSFGCIGDFFLFSRNRLHLMQSNAVGDSSRWHQSVWLNVTSCSLYFRICSLVRLSQENGAPPTGPHVSVDCSILPETLIISFQDHALLDSIFDDWWAIYLSINFEFSLYLSSSHKRCYGTTTPSPGPAKWNTFGRNHSNYQLRFTSCAALAWWPMYYIH